MSDQQHNTQFISEEDRALLNELRERKNKEIEQERKLKARTETLNKYLKDDDFKLLYDNELKDMLDKRPALIDNEETFSFAIDQAKSNFLNKQTKQQEPVPQQQSAKPPLIQTPIVSDNQTNQEEGVVLQNLSYKEMVAAGINKTTAMFAKAFPPREEIRIKSN